MNLNEQRKAALAAAQTIVDGAKAAGRDLTVAEQAQVEARFAEIREIDQKRDAAAKSQELLATLAGTPKELTHGPNGEPVGGTKDGMDWARGLAAQMKATAEAQGQKSTMIPVGTIGAAPVVSVIEAPNTQPTTLLDLIGRVQTNAPGGEFLYLRQSGFTNNAAVVPPGELKPVSSASFEEVRTKAVVVAHVSEPLPISWFDDYAQVITVLERQLRQGLLQKTEDLVLNGDATVKGILTTTGVRAQAFTTDVITTLRTARLKLEQDGITPTAAVMNPADLAALELLRENGATGAFLFDGGLDRLLGGAKIVASNRLAEGKALLGDFRTVDLIVRDPLSSVRFDQHADFAQRNLALLRVEHRVGVSMTWPGALSVVSLKAA